MTVLTRLLLTTCCTFAVASCGVTIQSQSTMAGGATLEGRRTFAWDQELDRPTGDPRLENNHFFLDRMHEAIEWELALRGLEHDDSSPDLLLHHHLALEDHELVLGDDADDPAPRTYAYEQATVMVHAADPASGEDIWVAWASSDVGPALQSPNNMSRWVHSMVKAMFKDWPVSARPREE